MNLGVVYTEASARVSFTSTGLATYKYSNATSLDMRILEHVQTKNIIGLKEDERK